MPGNFMLETPLETPDQKIERLSMKSPVAQHVGATASTRTIRFFREAEIRDGLHSLLPGVNSSQEWYPE